MRRPNSPFAIVDGKPYLKVNYRYDDKEQIPSLLELVAELLKHVGERDIVLLRPLSKREQKELAEAVEDGQVDVYARLVVEEEDRFRDRRK